MSRVFSTLRLRALIASALTAAGLIASIAAPARAAQVDLTNATLADLEAPGAFAIVGDKRFDGFSNQPGLALNGALTPDPTQIKVSAITNGTQTGLFFQGGPFFTLNSQFVNFHFQFNVTEMDPTKLITTASLDTTAATSGGGTAIINETVTDNPNKLFQLAQLQNILAKNLPGGGVSGFDASFAGNVSIHIDKDMTLIGNSFNSGMPFSTASISSFSQTFGSTTAVPETSTMVSGLIGLGILAFYAKRRSSGKAANRRRVVKPRLSTLFRPSRRAFG